VSGRWIVSDLDGTLLDETERCPLPMDFLAEVSATHHVVLASSRTVDEIRDVAAALGWPAIPCVAEDGQVIVDASGAVTRLGLPTEQLLARLDALGHGAEVRAVMHSAHGRRASLLIPAESASQFELGVPDAGMRVTMGGTWATITGSAWNKGRAAARIMRDAHVSHWAAIGNGANDHSLLMAANQRFAIRDEDGTHHPLLATIPGVVLLTHLGPLGWPEMVSLLPTTPTLPPEPEGRHAPSSLDHHRPHDPGA
jgi:hydroxymethylpyrimidine pyrophosphatase-like HAD family hydrolase